MRSRRVEAPPVPPPEVTAAIVAAINEYLATEAGDEDADGYGRPLAWRISLGPTPAPGPQRQSRSSAWASAGRRDQMNSRQNTYDRKGFGR